MKKTAIYLRVSSKNQIENTSLDNQLEKIKAYCVAYDFEVVKVFKDSAKSGSSNNRQDYNSMIEFINSNEVDALIVYKSDRIHRQLKNLLIMVEDVLNPNNTSFISISEQFDTSTPQGKLFLNMIGSFAEFEKDIINERTKSGRVNTAKNNKHAGGEVPFGYKKINKDIEIDKNQSEIVKLIFNLYVEKRSLAKVKKELDNKNLTNKNNKPFQDKH